MLLLKKLPNNCTKEDIQYHLYVIEKILELLKGWRKKEVLREKR